MATETSKGGLERGLGFWGALAIVVGTTIGSGIFLVPKDMVANVGSPGMVMAVWVFGGLLSLAGALTYAELASALPGAGGEYVYLKEAYGPFFGFLYGWTQTWVAKAASIATLATAFFTYLANFWPALEATAFALPIPLGTGGSPLEIRYGQFLAMGVILALAGLNCLGVRVGGGLQIAVTIVKVGLIGLLIAAGLLAGGGDPANFRSAVPATGGATGFFAALVAALWAYDGWNNVGMVASEVKEPRRNLPRALIGGTLAIIGIYLLANLAYFYVLSAEEVATSDRVAAAMMRAVAGPRGAAAVSLAAMISIFAALNGSILSGARVPYAMARDGLYFPIYARVSPTHHSPSWSIVLLSLWSSVLVFSGRYDQLYTMVIFPSWILYAMAAASVIVLRFKRPDLPRPYRTLGYPLVPIAFVLVAIALLGSTLMKSPRESGLGLIVIAAGVPFYLVWRRSRAVVA
jgi:APA family basic amino acid/polyamine antiporter